MQQPDHIGEWESAGSAPVPAPPASMDAADQLEPLREDAVRLLRPDRERAVVVCLVAGALLVGIGLGWAGCLGWNSPTVVAAAPAARKDASLRPPDAKSPGKTENIRKQAPAVTGSIPAARPQGPSPQGASTNAARADVEGPKTVAALPSTIALPGVSAESRPLLTPTPETRPTTIEGWTVLDVRGGAAVLQGPDGVRTAMPGDSVPGIGRVDSIVRWGNRWIVATANGLIASP